MGPSRGAAEAPLALRTDGIVKRLARIIHVGRIKVAHLLPRLTAGPPARASAETPSPLGLGLNETIETPKLFLSRS